MILAGGPVGRYAAITVAHRWLGRSIGSPIHRRVTKSTLWEMLSQRLFLSLSNEIHVNSPDQLLGPESTSVHLIDDVDAGDQDAKIRRCQDIIDYQFSDETLLRAALTHASGASNRLASNERLEFLGDAVLGLMVCEWLFEEYPEYNEGDLTKIKSAVVSRRSCGRVACRLGLDRCLIVGRGVTRNRSYPRSLVSDVFESVIAAIYLDGGRDAIRDRIRDWLQDEVDAAVESQGASNYKSSLQQHAQRDLANTPVYQLVRETGPDHRKAFLIAAVIGDQSFTPAWGNNKKDAEQRAAANALAELREEPLPYPSGAAGESSAETSA
ncbi:Ribonuclease 3 [Crateriforma conspicua]|uniref:Ribonuclease 3 n=1 Tax=Crateriforma conspicua TaxID=2527996 RepID=A0A5C6FSG3_9PLAN|nr:Ribonuclease 3 [Crateriforma conspicua]